MIIYAPTSYINKQKRLYMITGLNLHAINSNKIDLIIMKYSNKKDSWIFKYVKLFYG